MYDRHLFNYYRIGRFLFAAALVIAFLIAGFPGDKRTLLSLLLPYALVSLARLFYPSAKPGVLDFILDIAFVTAIVHLNADRQTYLTLLYLFPIFFSTVLIDTRTSFLFPLISLMLYGMLQFLGASTPFADRFLNVSLHLLSFTLIAIAGVNLKKEMENRGRYIQELEDEKIRMQGYERLYRVSADLAHELRNPLASISAAAQFLKEGKTDREFIEMIQNETARLTHLVNDFLLFSRPADARKEAIDVCRILRELPSRILTEKNIALGRCDAVVIQANRTFLEVALLNIVKNAAEAAQSTVSMSLAGQGRELALIVEDDGPGIDEGLRDRIFEPFFTTKESGTGLGLAISYRIITSLGGAITIEESPLGGAKFVIRIPIR